ncbi:hypothetical protein BY458DRAFT_479523 [Sporodiniella umbellata]|nr:hypothetical protein BY458DRAFT_479523 [Sporodiniella umbellata]
MAATLAIPEKSNQEILLVHKFLKSNVSLTTGELALEVSGEKVNDAPNAIVKYLVSQSRPELLGKNATEQAQVDEWLSFATQGLRSAGKKEITSHIEKKFNHHLSSQTYFVGHSLTVVDVVIFGILHAYSKNFKATQCPNTMRWFDLIQHEVIEVHGLTAEFPKVEFKLDDVPEPAMPVAAAAPVETDQPVVSRMEIRVGLIKSCKKHEGADSLYVEEIDVGEAEPRTIVSGLVRWYPVEQMENRYVLVLCNLKPASMRGVKSFGMVLCASAADGSAVELLGPVDTSKVKPGDKVYIEGQEGEHEKVLNPKKKYWEAVQPDLKTDEACIAHYTDKPLLIKTASGESVQCKVASVKNGGIK